MCVAGSGSGASGVVGLTTYIPLRLRDAESLRILCQSVLCDIQNSKCPSRWCRGGPSVNSIFGHRARVLLHAGHIVIITSVFSSVSNSNFGRFSVIRTRQPFPAA